MWDEDVTARKSRRSRLLTERLVGKNVLLVEDSRTYATALTDKFKRFYGMDVTHCSSLAALQEALVEGADRFGIALVDLNLPGAPGGEALDLLLANRVPPVVFTATFSENMRHAVLAKPVADYVLKDGPQAIDTAVASVVRLLANRDIHILVVDDVTSTRELMASHLRAQLFEVSTVARGSDALARLESGATVDLAVVDYEMPELNGVELVQAIRSNPDYDRLRIIGVSSAERRDLMTEYLKAGANDFIHRPFDMEEFNWRVAQNASTVLQIRHLRELSARDYLTGLYNRRYFFEEGPRRVAAGRNADTPVPQSMAVLDIDHFKRLNDTYGHELGDAVLKDIACRLTRYCGESHLLARLGGEEFGILISGLDLREAKAFCENLRQSIAANPVTTVDGELTLTISIGLAEVAAIETFDNYLNAADQFLYMAKHAGRNCVISENDLRSREVA